MANFGFYQVHLAHAALVLLEGGDLLRVRRPKQDWTVAVDPAGVVGGVAEIFYAVGSKLGLLGGGNVAHPEIEIANECSELFVGREHLQGAQSALAAGPGPVFSVG